MSSAELKTMAVLDTFLEALGFFLDEAPLDNYWLEGALSSISILGLGGARDVAGLEGRIEVVFAA